MIEGILLLANLLAVVLLCYYADKQASKDDSTESNKSKPDA